MFLDLKSASVVFIKKVVNIENKTMHARSIYLYFGDRGRKALKVSVAGGNDVLQPL